MEPRDVAGLKRKYAATQEPAKKAELGTLLRSLGHDPDEVKETKDTKVPDGRTADQKVTTEKAEAAQEKATPKRPGRPAKEAEPKAEVKEEKPPAKGAATSDKQDEEKGPISKSTKGK